MAFVPLEDVWPDRPLASALLRPKSELISGYTRFMEGDILIPKITPTFEANRTILASGLPTRVGCGTTELHVVRPGRRLEARFARYVLSSEAFLAGGAAAMKGVAGQQRVPDDFVRDFPVPAIAVTEQRAIADFLDAETARIDRMIEMRKRGLALVSERFASLIDSTVSGLGGATRLGRAAEILPGYAFPSDEFLTQEEGSIRLLRGVNVEPSRVRWRDVVYVDQRALGRFSRYRLEVGDIVFGMDRPMVAGGLRVARLDEVDTPALLVQRVARIRAHPTVSQGYLWMLLRTKRFDAYLEPIFTGVSVPHVSDSQLSAFEIPLPPYGVQHRVTEMLEGAEAGLSEERTLMKRHIELLMERRQALITAAVLGNIGAPVAA
jgi:type I restriction enzyme S subunit